MLWQNDLKYFNVVALTQNWTNFFALQIFRLVASLGLIVVSILYFFIYGKRVLFNLSIWALTLTTITFCLLFIGSGMQVCEQKNLMRGKKGDPKKLAKLWRTAVFLYNQSLPLVLTANLIFWLEHVFFMLADLKLLMQVYIIFDFSGNYNWRYSIIYVAHIMPATCLLVEMSMNRLRIPLHHVIYNVLIIGLYALVTFCYQILDEYEAIFFHSLNFKCKHDRSFLYNKETMRIPDNSVLQGNCDGREDDPEYACVLLYPYTCHDHKVT